MLRKIIIATLLGVIASAVASAQVQEPADSLEESPSLRSEVRLYATVTETVAVGRFPKTEFFLHCPLADGAWKVAPNVLDSLAHPDFPVIFLPSDTDEIYFSGVTENGRRGIYVTCRADSVWTRPAAVLEDALAGADCLFPMLSPDRLSLYFSASGLDGNGGYDLYVTSRESMDGRWCAPVNMGYPFSSEGNDYLFAVSDDARHAAYASDRENAADSIDVCVIAYEETPSTREVADSAELAALCRLVPQRVAESEGTEARDGGIPENEETRNYMEKMDQVRSLRDSINFHHRRMDMLRADYDAATDGAERTRMYEEIREREKTVPELQRQLEQAIVQLQEIEMDFLFKGVVLDPEKLGQKDEQSEGFMFPDGKISGFPSDFVIRQ